MREGSAVAPFFAAIGVSERDAITHRWRRAESRLCRMRFAGEGHGQQGAAMKGIFKTNYRWALGVSARDFDGIFYCFRAGIHDDGFLGSFAGRLECFNFLASAM